MAKPYYWMPMTELGVQELPLSNAESESCPQKDRCGSCSWSRLPYAAQLDKKLELINASAKLAKLNLTCAQIVASPKVSHYRNRMDFVIDYQGRVGLREKGKWWSVIDNHCCFISDERIEKLFAEIRDWVRIGNLSYFDRKAHHGLLRYALIRVSLLGESLVSIITSRPADSIEEKLILANLEKLAEQIKVTSLVWSICSSIGDQANPDEVRIIHGPGFLCEEVGGIKYRIYPHGFFQTNSHAAPILLETVREFSQSTAANTLVDLYCGSGFFALALANNFERVVGAEIDPISIQRAKENGLENKLEVEFYSAKAEEFAWEAYAPEVLIVDPPRAGLHPKALSKIVSVKPQRIVYVSCNYERLMPDLVVLSQHYDVSDIRAIDMFPHTPHVEVVSNLTLRS